MKQDYLTCQRRLIEPRCRGEIQVHKYQRISLTVKHLNMLFHVLFQILIPFWLTHALKGK